MKTPLYPYRNPVKISTSTPFRDPDTEVTADPDTVTFYVRAPDGTDSTYVYGADDEVTTDGTGDYALTIRPDQGGVWNVGIEGVGTLDADDEIAFEVKHPKARDES